MQLKFLAIIYILPLMCFDTIVSAQENVRIRNQRPEISRTRVHQRPNVRLPPCEQSSCYPPTGNLIIGREKRLTASSTCGLSQQEQFCSVSEEKKCFFCETNSNTKDNSQLNHQIEQIIYKYKPGTLEPTWWQSENGVEDVYIQLDLETEFHFTHLIIVFSTFRPAAMLVERSCDFGKTWQVYRYFASNCAESFPHVLVESESKNITDVVCDQRFSGLEYSKNGEVILRAIQPNMKITHLYADYVQNMLKITNLRVNFTKLHTLGDSLLDDRPEIQEKYYYGISHMVVRGSCTCHGHASSCLPLDGFETRNDMVHGRCDCQHHTKGLNCELCDDFFNDLPWKPALGNQTNACKECNCNNHSTSCHFDQDVYKNSGLISGGVCDNCEHNTLGQHCEQCKPFFYRDPNEDIQSPFACKPCDCDPLGSLDERICVSTSEGNAQDKACHCKKNTKGSRCDFCKEGFWNLTTDNPDGCESCTCNILGTVDNLGCDFYTGECLCKRLVLGKYCDRCMFGTYGLSDTNDGCRNCDCDFDGSLDSNCDIITGQCKCKPHMQGRNCSELKQNYLVQMFQAKESNMAETNCGKPVIGRQILKGGIYIRRGEYPWNAVLLHENALLCGGTIVSKTIVVTAAHCLKGKHESHEFFASDILVSVGIHDLSKSNETGRITLGVMAIRIHHDWNINIEMHDADIAILELEREITFNTFIQPICLAKPESLIANITNGFVVGFGRSENRDFEDVAKKLNIPIVDYHKCSESVEHRHLLSPRTFCGGTEDGRGVCDGDSGSGVYVVHNRRAYLRGIVSASLSDVETGCNVYKHAVFTKATDFYDWIKSGGTKRYV